MLNDCDPIAMAPSYKDFTGEILQVNGKLVSFGRIARLEETHLEITEVTVRTWTQKYKEKVLETMLDSIISDPRIT